MIITQINFKKIYCFILMPVLYLILYGCNNANDTYQHQPTIEDSGIVTGNPTDDTLSTGYSQPSPKSNINVDTELPPPPPPKYTPIIKNAQLGYSYYPKMKRGERKIIRAFVAINNPEGKIKDTLRLIEKNQTIETSSSDTSTINIINNIPFYKKIKITIDTTNDFIIKAIRANQQTIDTIKGNLWIWQITAQSNKSVADITLLVDAETPEGNVENIDIRQIKINIEIDKITMVRASVNYLGENPKVSIPILVSLAGFIGWLMKYKLDKKKTVDKK